MPPDSRAPHLPGSIAGADFPFDFGFIRVYLIGVMKGNEAQERQAGQ